MTFKVVIIEDESRTCSLLKKMMEDIDLSIEVVGTAHSVEEGIRVIQETTPQIILLDIQMPGGSGFDILNSFEQYDFEVIFVTAHEEYALKAIKVSAIDYILKPVNKEELATALQNAIQAFSQKFDFKKRYQTLLDTLQEKQRKIVVKTKKSMFIVDQDDIVHCQSDRNYTFFYLSDGRKILTSKSLKEYEPILTLPDFIRCHRSYIVNLKYIDRYEHKDGGTIIMKDNTEIPLSRSSKEAFLDILENL